MVTKRNIDLTGIIRREILAIFFLIFFSSNSVAGPFGLEMGKKFEDYPSVTFKKMEGTSYQVINIPIPNRLMSAYLVAYTEKTGICFIKAVSKNITTSQYGTELNTQYNSISDALTKKYLGAYTKEKNNFLQSGSIWNEPRDYMMALVKKERYMITSWEAKSNSSDVAEIFLAQKALSQEEGYLILEYYGRGWDYCQKETKKDDAEGF